MKETLTRILLWFAFKFRWKSKRWGDMYMNLYSNRVKKLVSGIELDIKDIRLVEIKDPD